MANRKKRPTLWGYIKFCRKHGLSDWGSYCLMSQFEDLYEGGAAAGQEIPWRPGYYLWPDGTERQQPPPRR